MKISNLIINNLMSTVKEKKAYVEEESFHHTSPFECGLSILENGILPNYKLRPLGLARDTFITFANGYTLPRDDANGDDKVSLAKMGINPGDNWLMGYSPFNPSLLDFVISNQVSAYRNSQNYHNEYLATSVDTKYIRQLHVRFSNLMELVNKGSINIGNVSYIDKKDEADMLLDYYYLIDMASYIWEHELPVEILEVDSNRDAYTLDTLKLSKLPKIK